MVCYGHGGSPGPSDEQCWAIGIACLLILAGLIGLGIKHRQYRRANPWDVGFVCRYCGTPAPGKGRNWPTYKRRATGKERMQRHGRSLTPVPIYETIKTDSFAFDSPNDHAEDCPHYKSLEQIKAEFQGPTP